MWVQTEAAVLLQSPKSLNKELANNFQALYSKLCTFGLKSASNELVVLSNCTCDDQALHRGALNRICSLLTALHHVT